MPVSIDEKKKKQEKENGKKREYNRNYFNKRQKVIGEKVSFDDFTIDNIMV